MELNWRRQLKAKAGYVAMAISGTVLTPFFFTGFIALMQESLIGALVVFFLMLCSIALGVCGVVGIIAVVKHNKKVEEAYVAAFDAEVAKDIARIKGK